MSICVPPLQPLDYTAILTLPPAPENSAGQKTAGTTAHLLTGSSGYRHKRAVASVPVASPYYGKRSAQVYQGLLEEKDHLFGKRSAAVYLEFGESNADNFYSKREAPYWVDKREAPGYPYKREAPGYWGGYWVDKREAPRYPYKREAAESLEVDESNADNFLGKREAPYFWGKREAPRYPYKRDAARYPYKREFDGSNADNVYGHYYGKREAAGYPYKRSAAESLEDDESNADYDLGKEKALAGPSASRHHIGKRSVPVDVQQESFVGKRAAPTSMDAEYDSYYY